MDDDIYAQITDWQTDNFVKINEGSSSSDADDDDGSNSSDSSTIETDNSHFKIIIFAILPSLQRISIHVNEFPPFFYIKVPDYWLNRHKTIFLEWVIEKLPIKFKDCVIKKRCTLEKRKIFRGFHNHKKFKFIRMVFSNTNAMRCCSYQFTSKHYNREKDRTTRKPKPIMVPGLNKKPYYYNLYESNIDPLLRFIHIKDIFPCGWIHIKKEHYELVEDDKKTTSDVEISTKWTHVNPHITNNTLPIKICAFDIECDSSHGDFPLAKKDYSKPAKEIIDDCIEIQNYIQKYRTDKNNENVHICREVLANPIEYLTHILKIMFEIDKDSSQKDFLSIMKRSHCDISKIYTKKNRKPSHKDIELAACKIMTFQKQSFEEVFKLFDIHDDKKKKRKELISSLTSVMNTCLPPIEGDHVIQIGSCFINYGEKKPYRNHMITLNTCDNIDNVDLEVYQDERKVLMSWLDCLHSENPDIITGYNIFNFDLPYLYERAEDLGIINKFALLGRLLNTPSKLTEKQGKIMSKFVDMPGRVLLDIFKIVQRDYNLDSYKLDAVSSNFIRGSIQSIQKIDSNKSIIHTDNTKGLNIGNYVMIIMQKGHDEDKYNQGQKFMIDNITEKTISVQGNIKDIDLDIYSCQWCLGKDDVSAQDIFRLQKGNSYDRYIIAKYCIMDVILCVDLLNKLELVTNNIGMANVCYTPLSWIILRGQGIKVLSLISKECRKLNYAIPVLYPNENDNDGYEGAIVLPPNPGIYLDDSPISVLDYASLYPSSIISENLSHETLVTRKEWLGDAGGRELQKLGYDYVDIEYDKFNCIKNNMGTITSKHKIGTTEVRYVQYRNGTKGILPTILKTILSERKKTRKKIKYKKVTCLDNQSYIGLLTKEQDHTIIKDEYGNETTVCNQDIINVEDAYSEFQQKILDGTQLALKVTANSIYGALGARTNAVYWKEIAASTTATGRKQLYIAKDYIEKNYKGSKIVYGDTDSVFVKFNLGVDEKGNPLRGKAALQKSIEMGIQAGHDVNKVLKAPQDLEYEKTFMPFILLSKKRYVGNKYEFDVNKYKQNSMGIVLKRRDNASILKLVYGGIIDILMSKQNIKQSIEFLKSSLQDIMNNKYDIEKFIITKTLSPFYKNPEMIAHKVLADRMTERDPGNKPQVNDRIPFVYIQTKNKDKKVLQGDKVEHPDYVIENKLKIDYGFYITNQLMKPISQIFALIIEQLDGFKYKQDYYKEMEKTLLSSDMKKDTVETKIKNLKQKEAEKILFSDILRDIDNANNSRQVITKWFTSN